MRIVCDVVRELGDSGAHLGEIPENNLCTYIGVFLKEKSPKNWINFILYQSRIICTAALRMHANYLGRHIKSCVYTCPQNSLQIFIFPIFRINKAENIFQISNFKNS